MKIDFSQISDEEMEFLAEDLLREFGFTIRVRPGRGPDQGKDILADRWQTDDLGMLDVQRVLVECKHFFGSGNSVREKDIGNFQMRMKQHKANRYLLVTTTMASATVSAQLSALGKAEFGARKATYWGRTDLIERLQASPEIFAKYFRSWEKQAKEAVQYSEQHFTQAHRGAILWSPGVTAIFGNDGYSDKRAARELKLLRAQLKKGKVTELAFAVDEEEQYSWAMLVRTDDAYEMHQRIWNVIKGWYYGKDTLKWEIEYREAHKVLYTYWDRPHHGGN